MNRLLLCLPLALLAPGDEHRPPAVGTIAKPLETVYWYALDDDRREPEVADYRGKVLLVHSWGYYCGPCIREGVPYVVDLMRAHHARGLEAVSISVGVDDGMPDDHFVKVGREMGLHHPLGMADGYGEMTPYVNMNVNRSLTWCFVIGREGGVRWAGDPSIDDDAFLEAVRAAVFEEPLPALPAAAPDALAEAVAAYVGGDLGRARDLAERAQRKLAKQQPAEAEAAAAFVALVDAYRDAQLARLARAVEARDAREVVLARRNLLDRFRKTDAAKVVKAHDQTVKSDDELAEAVEAWTRWFELREAAPALYPVRVDRDTTRYAKQLETYVERAGPGAPGLDEARAWLSAFEPK